jgi:type I restriction enzyme R subunit
MVVTDSRLAAIRYKQEFDKYIKTKGYHDIKTLVAFSGTVIDPDNPEISYTEVAMNNGIKEKGLPEKFASDEYQVLLVAEKYQTGFDQPFLHTMYVDKRLSGIQAVQTLSRLNRTCAGKEDTFVLDFRNEREEIFKSFKPYYESTKAEELTDPHNLYRLQAQIDERHIIYNEEIQSFCAVYFKPKRTESVHDHASMNAILDKAVVRFKDLDEEDRAAFKKLLVEFRNLYGFLSQVIPYQDSDLEKLYTYIRFLLPKLPRRQGDPVGDIESEVELQYYRLQKISEGSIDLKAGEASALKSPGDVGTGNGNDEEVLLSELVEILNAKFGTDFTQADQLFFDQIQEEAVANENLRQAAAVNSVDDFRYVFDKAFEALVIDRMEGNEEIFGKLMGNSKFRKLASENLLHKVYRKLNLVEDVI